MEVKNKPERPNNHLALAIISTILCCLPTGIVSIIYASKVNREYEDGNYDKSISASKNAKTWWIVSIVTAIVLWLVYFLIFGLAFLGAASSGQF
ncbi:CD225/dispanin family protein [uncultured Winogradskyella sp.]|uniref:CD225/dispanin family protein n=1 Tax=uncultured Winogradskyella sp. TaxID=395353 RepID=UPI0030DDA067|tara:strand:- start:79530 stop:79811 length:282 start_codon:yes stop_codon:yes gene_type:complete